MVMMMTILQKSVRPCFSPVQVFLNICSAVSIGNIQTLWPLPFNVILQVIIGRALGSLVTLVFRPPVEYRPIVFGAVAVGNLGNLPLSLLETFCSNSQSQAFGGDDCAQVGQGYVALGIIPAVVVQVRTSQHHHDPAPLS